LRIRTETREGRQRFRSPRALWWLNPRFAILCLGIPFLLFSYLIPESTYLILYRAAGKHVDFDFVLVGLLIYAAFVAGTFFLVRTGVHPQQKDTLLYCRWVVWPLFTMTALGYLVWVASATVRSGGPGTLLSTLVNVVLVPEAGATDYVKRDLFQTIPGVTTFTQFGILYATVEALLWVYRGSPRKIALLRFIPLLVLCLLRAVLISERLALVEFAVPVIVVLLTHARWTRISDHLIRFAPLFGGFAVFAYFVFTEYFRSWTFYQADYTGSYIRFAAERFLGYYATAVNNAAAHYYYGQVEPLRNTLTFLLEFPVLGALANSLYYSLFEVRGMDHIEILFTYTNPEFNNVALIGSLHSDFSVYFVPLAAFFIGVVSISLYRSFTQGRLTGLILYPSWFIGLLEVSRIYYWPGGRYFPVLAFLVGSLILFKLAKVPADTLPTGTRRQRDAKARALSLVETGEQSSRKARM
jgi:hypothetical protein